MRAEEEVISSLLLWNANFPICSRTLSCYLRIQELGRTAWCDPYGAGRRMMMMMMMMMMMIALNVVFK